MGIYLSGKCVVNETSEEPKRTSYTKNFLPAHISNGRGSRIDRNCDEAPCDNILQRKNIS